MMYQLFISQVNCGIGGAPAAITLSNRLFLPLLRTGGNHGYHVEIKAKASVNADVLAKDLAGVEVDADKNGKTSFHFRCYIVNFDTLEYQKFVHTWRSILLACFSCWRVLFLVVTSNFIVKEVEAPALTRASEEL